MKNNILVAVLLLAGLLTPACGWIFYIWYRSHVKKQHQEGQIFGRRNLDRSQANYEPANGPEALQFGPSFTTRGWVRPKNPEVSFALRPPRSSLNPRSPRTMNRQGTFGGIQDQNLQDPSQANTHTSQMPNQQPNPLSKRQQKKQRALKNKQRQQENNQNHQWNNGSNGNPEKQKRRNKNNQGQDHQTSTNSKQHQDEQEHGFKTTEGQSDQHNNRGDGNGHGDTESKKDQKSNNSWAGGWGREEPSGHQRSRSNWGQDGNEWGDNNRWAKSCQASPEHASRNPSRTRGGWDNDGDKQRYQKETTGYQHASPERSVRGRSSHDRDWGQNDQGWADAKWPRSNSWGRGNEHRGGSPSWSQDGNVHRNKKQKKERWQIETEGNEEHERNTRQSPTRSHHEQNSRYGRSPPRDTSVAGWDSGHKDTGWKDAQVW